MRRRKKYKHKYILSSESPLKFPYFPGMTEFSGTQMNARLSYIDEAPYFENNKTYRVNNYTYGMFHDILQLLENQLNFSTTLYKRKDAVWGYIYPQPNGTYTGTGINFFCIKTAFITLVKDTFIFIIRHCGRYIFQKGRSSCCSFI